MRTRKKISDYSIWHNDVARLAHEYDRKVTALDGYHRDVESLYHRAQDTDRIDADDIIGKLTLYGNQYDDETARLSRNNVRQIQHGRDEYAEIYRQGTELQHKFPRSTDIEENVQKQAQDYHYFLRDNVLTILKGLLLDIEMKRQDYELQDRVDMDNKVIKAFASILLWTLGLGLVSVILYLNAYEPSRFVSALFMILTLPSSWIACAMPIAPYSPVVRLNIGRACLIANALGMALILIDFFF